MVVLAPDSSNMYTAVRFTVTTETGFLKLGLQSSNCSRQWSSSAVLPFRTRSSNARGLVVRAAEECDADIKKVTGIKRAILPSGENVVKLPETSKTRVATESWQDNEEQRKRRWTARRAAKTQTAVRQLEERLNLVTRKKNFAEKELAKLDGQMKLADASPVKERITEEERYMFQKLGLKMRDRLLLERRGVSGVVVENMHLYWKHMDLVKIVFKGPVSEAEYTARILEVESGGVLVGNIATSEGHAIIFYRGRNYQRPSELTSRDLLTRPWSNIY